MTVMTASNRFLDQDPEQLEQYLLRLARSDAAPEGARERTLVSVASAALGVSALSGAATYGSGTSLTKVTTLLVAKWLAVGLGSGLITLAAAQSVQQLAAHHSEPASGPASPQREPSHATRSVSQRITPEGDEPAPAAVVPTAGVPTAGAPSAAPTSAAFVPNPAISNAANAAAAPHVANGASPASPAASASSASQATATSGEASPLTRELALLERARSALARRSPASALESLDGYREQFPNGSLQVEAAALRVEAVGQSGDRALALKLADSFLTSYPKSLVAARVRALSETFRAAAGQP